MIGCQVEQRQLLGEKGEVHIALSGEVVALERGGFSTWSALIMRKDGSLTAVPAEYLTVVAVKAAVVAAEERADRLVAELAEARGEIKALKKKLRGTAPVGPAEEPAT